METHKAKKLIIITEKLIQEQVCELIEKSHVSGYTFSHVGGKGSRNVRSSFDGSTVVGDFSNVKIEVILKDKDSAKKLMEEVVNEFFENFSGIAYLEDVEILREAKFL